MQSRKGGGAYYNNNSFCMGNFWPESESGHAASGRLTVTADFECSRGLSPGVLSVSQSIPATGLAHHLPQSAANGTTAAVELTRSLGEASHAPSQHHHPVHSTTTHICIGIAVPSRSIIRFPSSSPPLGPCCLVSCRYPSEPHRRLSEASAS